MNEPGPGWDCHVHVFDATASIAAGHYTPAYRPLAQIEAEAAAHGVGHLVLVQPSVYGCDNRLLLQALAQQPGRHRAVVVLAEQVDAQALNAMHAAGVRGARLNCVSPLGRPLDISARFRQLAPLLLERGWHLQWYARPEQLAEIAALHGQGTPPCVLDHLGGVGADTQHQTTVWQTLARLADSGAWIKFSGWYRLAATEPYDALLPLIQRLAQLFDDRGVWGSDWPHTFFDTVNMPSYASTWAPVAAALGTPRADRLRNNLPAIYR